jgi:membrane dipeptidase
VKLDYVDHAADPGAWARALGCSREAVEIVLAGPFIDLHNDMEVPVRLFGYRPERRHGPWRRPMPFFGHTDYPRVREARLTGVVLDLATNVFRRPASRQAITLRNLERCQRQIAAWPEDLGLARTRAEYDAVVASGRTAMMLALQGGNALEADLGALDGPLGQALHRVTLIHLKSSAMGGSNSPGQPDRGITELGRAMVAACNRNRVFVDLSHAGVATFWGALDAHDPTMPPIVSHAGAGGVRPLWRNVDDDQVRAIADRGGVVGVVYQGNFLDDVLPGFPCYRRAIVDHLAHLIAVGGEGVAAIGTDYDGVITPPWDLPDVTHHPLLVQDMLDRGWSVDRIRNILGLNYLRAWSALRP